LRKQLVGQLIAANDDPAEFVNFQVNSDSFTSPNDLTRSFRMHTCFLEGAIVRDPRGTLSVCFDLSKPRCYDAFVLDPGSGFEIPENSVDLVMNLSRRFARDANFLDRFARLSSELRIDID
jgi:hypothetical protein